MIVGTSTTAEPLYGVMDTSVALLDKPTQSPARSTRTPEPLLREALGLTLRAFRADKGVTLRELAGVARVSPGYLSELERGRKEVSSELLASVCYALDVSVSDVLIEAAGYMALPSMDEELASTAPAASEL
ncbi:helix-turn-helix transcriptional regulator [Corynebacterium aurimucosum]